MSKFNKWQKCVELLFFLILSCAALFPATWRMTDEEKSRIPDLEKYQEKYTGIFVIVNAIISFVLVLVLLLIG